MLQIERVWNEKLKSEFHYSYFTNSLGILRGAHAGNLTGLQLAINAKQPLFTDTKRGFDIDAPSQNVQHHLFKTHFIYSINSISNLQFIYGWQHNNRKEFASFDYEGQGDFKTPTFELKRVDENTIIGAIDMLLYKKNNSDENS